MQGLRGRCCRSKKKSVTVRNRGVGTVFDSKEVLILINGHNKARALAATVEGEVSRSGLAVLYRGTTALSLLVMKQLVVS